MSCSVDYNVTVKCFSDECKKCNIWDDNGNCQFGKFHGPTGAMEVNNALALFNRSIAFGYNTLNTLPTVISLLYPT